MSTSKNVLDAFEQNLKESLDQYEVPYNSTDWNQMEHALNGGRTGWWMSGVGLSILAAGTLAVGGAGWYALSSVTPNEAVAATELGASSSPALPQEATTNGTASAAAEQQAPEKVPAATDGSVVATNTEASVDADDHSSSNTTTASPSPEKRDAASMAPASSTDAATPLTKGPSASAEGTFTASVAEGCQGTSVDFKVEHMPEDGIYLWNFGDGSFSNKANPEHTFTKPGNYQVTLSLSRPGAGTIQNRPSSDMIVIHEAPKAAFNILKQEYEGHLPSVHFENRSLAGAQYHWDFGDGQTSAIAHPDHIYKKKGVYNVELTTTNEIGCVDKVRKEVRIDKDYNLDAPASFSPNGDGSEETFIPEALRTLSMKFNLTIYSPSGTLVYETSEANKPWLGKLNNRGEVLPAGDYVWVVDVRESLHLGETYTGKVKLAL